MVIKIFPQHSTVLCNLPFEIQTERNQNEEIKIIKKERQTERKMATKTKKMTNNGLQIDLWKTCYDLEEGGIFFTVAVCHSVVLFFKCM